MQAVGNQVITAILLMITPIALVFVFYWNTIKDFYLRQIADHNIPLQQPHERQQVRRQRNDQTCAICLQEPKKFQVSSTCGHSFCGTCIIEIWERGQQLKIKCPICRNEISVLFKCFHQQLPTQQATQIHNKLRTYNMLFDDNRPFLRRILEFPYIFKRLIGQIFSMRFLIFFIRNIYFIRLIFMALFYLILPIDLLPESYVGIIGFVDDIFVFLILSSYIITIVAVQYYRAHH